MEREEFAKKLIKVQGPLSVHCSVKAYNMLRGTSWEARDLLQETNFRALRSWHLFTDKGETLLHWCKTIANNLALNELARGPYKKTSRLDAVGLEIAAEAEDYRLFAATHEEPDYKPKETAQMMRYIEQELDPENAICLLYSLEGKPTKESAKELGISNVLYRWKTFRGRETLRKHLLHEKSD